MNFTELSENVKRLLCEKGAQLVGVGDMSGVENCRYSRCISVAISLPRRLIRDLQTAPTREYSQVYFELNEKLNEIVLCGEQFLRDAGYEAYAQTTDRVLINERRASSIPHKTAATRAGLGWIGKNNLLVTQKFGSAVRLSSLLTNAPLECDAPIQQSRCGSCSLCVQQCPAHALQGALWRAGMPRERLVDVEICYEKQREIMRASTGIDTDLCGKCFAVCAYTQRYVRAGSAL